MPSFKSHVRMVSVTSNLWKAKLAVVVSPANILLFHTIPEHDSSPHIGNIVQSQGTLISQVRICKLVCDPPGRELKERGKHLCHHDLCFVQIAQSFPETPTNTLPASSFSCTSEEKVLGNTFLQQPTALLELGLAVFTSPADCLRTPEMCSRSPIQAGPGTLSMLAYSCSHW